MLDEKEILNLKICIGTKIRECREKEKITQAELGKKMGVSTKKVSRLELGECIPNLVELLNVSRALGKPFFYFLGDISEFFDGIEKSGPVYEFASEIMALYKKYNF